MSDRPQPSIMASVDAERPVPDARRNKSGGTEGEPERAYAWRLYGCSSGETGGDCGPRQVRQWRQRGLYGIERLRVGSTAALLAPEPTGTMLALERLLGREPRCDP